MQPANGWVVVVIPKAIRSQMPNFNAESPEKRSSGTLEHCRLRLSWPNDREFRILTIDGGGIRGIFPATFLAGLEERYLGGESIAGYFDLVAGTSTGGIIALGLAAGFTAAELRDLYIVRGCEIFPPIPNSPAGWLERAGRLVGCLFKCRYDREALMQILCDTFGSRKFGEARTRLCIPSFDGRYGEVYIFKTPHHPDFKNDASELMTKVAAATSAAPTFFQPLEDRGYAFVDGGVWANNPIMVGLVDTLSCFSVRREQIRILSLGCGDEQYLVGKSKIKGGLWAWQDIILAAMRLQSLNAIGQAGLLIGRDKITRVDTPMPKKKIGLDGWKGAVTVLPDAARAALDKLGEKAASSFLTQPAAAFRPMTSGFPR